MASGEQVVQGDPMEQDWELVKENFQPLKAGRKPETLREFGGPVANASIEEQRKSFWDEIESYKGDDPLDVWLRFIKWTQETYKTGGHKAEIIPLLERCTRELQNIERYRTDIRYLRVWIQYADCLPEPGDVFSFLKENDIGQEHALFYIAHATYQELRGNYSNADNVYQQGINRTAAPLERLKSKHDEFTHRMARRIQRKAQEQAALGEDAGHPERHTLGVLGGRRPPRTQGLGGSKRKAVATPGKDNAPSGTGLSIFVDDEFSGGTTGAGSTAPVLGISSGSSGSLAGGSNWSQLASYEATRKENVQAASTWAGQRIKQKSTHAVPAAAPLDIPVDPELESQLYQPKQSDAGHVSLRQRLEQYGSGETVEEKLRHDPLQLHKAPAPLIGGGAPSASTQAGLAVKREEVLIVDVAALQGSDGIEQCFEEARGQKWLKENAQTLEAAKARNASLAVPATEPVSLSIPATIPETTPFDQDMELPVSQAAEQALSTIASQYDADAASDITMSTRNAFSAVNAMFSSRMQRDTSFEPTMTINTKDAFDAINKMFTTNRGMNSSSEAPSVEPTMSLKAAYDTVNQITGSGGPTASQASALKPREQSELFIRTDTGLQSSGNVEAGVEVDSPAGFAIREDTVFFSKDSFDIREDTVFINPRAGGKIKPRPPSSGGFDIREDTIFINKPSDNDENALGIREDTIFINRNPAIDAGDDEETGGIDIREDTVFIKDATVPSSPLGSVLVAGKGQASKWGFTPGEDETLVFEGTTEVLRIQPILEQSTMLTEQMGELELAQQSASQDGKENAEQQPFTSARKISEAAHSVLQPLSEGFDIEEDAEALEALAAPVQGGGDEFQVYNDAATVNPFVPAFQTRMLNMLDPPVSQWTGVCGLSQEDEQSAASVFKRTTKKATSALAASVPIQLAGQEVLVGRYIGAGAYATVYQACLQGDDVALKYESPACPWEWYICQVLQGRVVDHKDMFLLPSQLLLGSESSVLVMPRGKSGTLQDLINAYLKSGTKPEECIVMHCTLQLLRMLSELNTARIVHTDIKPDNFLISLTKDGSWSLKLQMIDFGRSVDLELLPAGTKLKGDCDTDAFRCVEMREKTPWLWQADAYSVAGVVHCLLYGDYMDVERLQDDAGKVFLRIKAPLRRYWDGVLWESVFDCLLNSFNGDTAPDMSGLIDNLESKLQAVESKVQEECSKMATLI